MEELKVPFAVKDDHGQPVWLILQTNNACEILRDDVPQQRSLARAGHAQHDGLHDAHSVRPVPGLTVNVITQNNSILLPGVFDDSGVTFPRYDNGSMGPLHLS